MVERSCGVWAIAAVLRTGHSSINDSTVVCSRIEDAFWDPARRIHKINTQSSTPHAARAAPVSGVTQVSLYCMGDPIQLCVPWYEVRVTRASTAYRQCIHCTVWFLVVTWTRGHAPPAPATTHDAAMHRCRCTQRGSTDTYHILRS